jgi:hypothetical protein
LTKKLGQIISGKLRAKLSKKVLKIELLKARLNLGCSSSLCKWKKLALNHDELI